MFFLQERVLSLQMNNPLFMKLLLFIMAITLGLSSVQAQECNAPQNLMVERESASVLWLKWEGNAPNYEMLYSVDGSSERKMLYISGNRHAITGFNANSQYDVWLRSVCGNGQFSEYIKLTHGNNNPCQTPLYLNHQAISPESVILSWMPSANVWYYNLEYRIKGAVNNIRSIQTTKSEVKVEGLRPNSEYEFRIASVCNNNSLSAEAIYTFTTEPKVMCSVPVGFTVRPYNISEINVGWNAVSGAEYYEVQWREPGTWNWNSATTYLTNGNINSLKSGISYAFRVRAICSSDMMSVSEWSSVMYSQTVPPTHQPQNCLVPTRMRVQIWSATSATLRWDGTSQAVGYELYQSTDGQNYDLIALTDMPSFELRNLMPMRYWYRVRAICGVGAFSNYATILSFRAGLWGRATEVSEKNDILNLYPNPASQSVSFQWESDEKATVQLIDLTRKIILSRPVDARVGSNELDLRGISAGVYMLQITSESATMIDRLIIQP